MAQKKPVTFEYLDLNRLPLPLVAALVEHGADVNPVDKWGKTPYQNLTSDEFAKKADPRAINRMKEALESMGAK